MAREQFNARLESDYAEAVKDFAEDRGLGKSVAARRLIVEGLRSQGYIGAGEENRSTGAGNTWTEGLALFGRVAFPFVLLIVALILVDEYTSLNLLITGTAWG